ncbi:hypothetical protein [Streptacidiphilus fuscans]|uniref:Uncharacterized protein n=1 Tax=Streptacidiphilus fuscans TaxID=2789292 RepID=A0A931FHA4_9ACTN|nr:hypothetical protein [Streptacidiphilus fuscans]MBF9068959.1 hypothetical protein [Streptacidiphilus fuscans]MBF9073413.1 hypothetical protein [Streptacidiphilus fuscans]
MDGDIEVRIVFLGLPVLFTLSDFRTLPWLWVVRPGLCGHAEFTLQARRAFRHTGAEGRRGAMMVVRNGLGGRGRAEMRLTVRQCPRSKNRVWVARPASLLLLVA